MLKYLNMEAIELENDFLKIHILPELGAKIASIFYKPQNFEVLFQPIKGFYEKTKYGDNYDKYDTSGIDEMFPNIDPGIYLNGKELPDHGELWSIPWKCKKENNKISCCVKSPEFNYIFCREIILFNNSIKLYYSVKNTGNDIFYGFWTFHGLLAIDEKSEIFLENVNQVLNVHNSKFLGKIGNICTYPEYNNYKLNKFLPPSSQNTEKFYIINKINKAEITLNNNKLKYTIEFPDIPYFGIWKNEGGFKNEYNCALEPSNGFYDSFEIAYKNKKILKILPNQVLKWDIVINLSE
ncbi:hypothetical protein Marpi_2051 [Marinitoga piezophila KA3]|uniref:Galactose mutarotase-like enzyme n=1 Tax=Marinitoga piezophila (strain DSM 14283 / JCM 11233 / KA3) TaxID=443254 RepID=H2J756_MARPK|nr:MULTISPECIES: hypothetical protein [Marinitoga]AEX86426.1 hypothetical protein Marpi_2051 [Marinitoga piezophila KA3]APT76814.1 hypothetical protein LN42_10835 [Marinitoga sp. 1137]NUU98513.1 hypothetical protein [Marinitoga sp. 1138]